MTFTRPEPADRPDPKHTPFLAAEALVRDLSNAKGPEQNVQAALRFVTDDPTFNSIILYTISQAWLAHFEGAPDINLLVELERSLTSDATTRAANFLNALAARVAQQERSRGDHLLGDAAFLLQLKERFPNLGVVQALKELTKDKP